MVTAQCCGRTSGSLNPRPRAYYLFIYLSRTPCPAIGLRWVVVEVADLLWVWVNCGKKGR